MSSSYTEICRTYLRRPLTSWPVGICVVANLPDVIATMIAPGMVRQANPECYGLSTGMLGYLLWLHFREQMTEQRRFILAGYVRPQVMAFATYAMLLFMAMPLEMIWWGGFHSVGLLATSLTFFALTGWAVVELSTILFFAGWTIWMAIMWGFTGDAFVRFVTGGFERQADILLAASLIAGIGAVARLCFLTEESRAFRRRVTIDTRNLLRPRMTGEDNARWTERRNAGVYRILGNPTAHPDAGLWRRAWAWSTLGAGGPILLPLMMPLLVAMFHWAPGLHMQVVSSSMLIALFICLCMISGAGIAPRWMQAWRHLEMAIVYPLRREELLKQIGLAIAINFVEVYATLAAMLIAMMWWVFPMPWDWASILAAMLAAAAFQFFGYATCVWMLRLRSPGWFFFGGGIAGGAIFLVTFVMYQLVGETGHFSDWMTLAVIFAVLVSIAAAAMIRDAWNRWLTTELG